MAGGPLALGHLREHVVDAIPLRVGAVPNGRTEEIDEQEVAVMLRGRRALEGEHGTKTEPRGHGGDRTATVGLQPAAGDEGVGVLGARLAE